jgi:hypothetical protein
MKKNKLSFAGIPALMLVFGLLLMGCPQSTDAGGGGTEDVPDGTTDKILFIKMDALTEASGSLYYTVPGSSALNMVSGKKMTSFSVNPQKTMIVFAEILSGYSGTWLATMNIDGSNYHRTNIQANNPGFNADGTLIYFDDDTDIYTVQLDGTDKQKLDLSAISGSKRYPRVSPDGTKLAFYQRLRPEKWYYDDEIYLYVLDLVSSTATRLTPSSIPVSYLNWNADGTRIAFSTTTGITPPVRNTYTVKADGSEAPVKITDEASPATGACGFPAYQSEDTLLCSSTKNKELCYYSSWDGDHYRYELATIKTDGTGLSIVLPGVSVKNPVWVSGD